MKSRFIVLVLLCSLTSCSYLTKQGRQERAYRSYIRKSTVVRAKQQRKFKFRTPEMAIRQDAPAMSAEPGSSQSPQSMTASPNAEQSPPPPN
jgi:hypothetical protein